MESYAVRRYREAAALLPPPLREKALSAETAVQASAEELRLRTGKPLYLTMPEGELALDEPAVRQEDLEQVLNLVTGYSRYAATETMRQGYLTARGGFRVGICGSAVMERGEIGAIRELSSLAIRIPREKRGLAEPVLEKLWEDRARLLESTLVIAPPGGGKTTFLRDMVRTLSERYSLRVALVDERGELAAVYRGIPQLEVGRHTDVMDACPKALAIPALLRAMNPQVIAVDEVAQHGDVVAMERAIHAGTVLLATVHGGSVEELRQKPLFSALLDTGVFTKAVCICREGGARRYEVVNIA